MHLDEIVPWGRSFLEYRQMFALTDRDLAGRILGCGDGPAAFNATLTGMNGSVVSVDPLYAFSAPEIRQRIDATAPAVLAGLAAHPERYCWSEVGSPEALLRRRLGAMETFLQDYARDHGARRYVAGTLPDLDFPRGVFDLALCSHFLFTYSDRLDKAFHLASIRSMLRVAREVRIFPLVQLDGSPSPHLDALCERLDTDGYIAAVEKVSYCFQKGGDHMLRIRRGTG